MLEGVGVRLSTGGRVTGTSSRAAYRFLLESIGVLEFGMVGGERRPPHFIFLCCGPFFCKFPAPKWL